MGKDSWIFCVSVLILCLLDIMNQKARLAWELYLKMGTSSDSFSLLQVIANDCYKVLPRPAAFASFRNVCMFSSNLAFLYIWIGTRTKGPGNVGRGAIFQVGALFPMQSLPVASQNA